MLAMNVLKKIYSNESDHPAQTEDVAEVLTAADPALPQASAPAACIDVNLEHPVPANVSELHLEHSVQAVIPEATPAQLRYNTAPGAVSEKSVAEDAGSSAVRIIGSRFPGCSSALKQLSYDIVNNLKCCKPLLSELSHACDTESRHFRLNMSDMAPADRAIIVSFANRLTGFLNRFSYDKCTCILSGYVGSIPTIVRYLKGEYLELALLSSAEKIVSEYAAGKGCDYCVLANALVSDGRFNNEFDLYIKVSDKEYVIEAKAGRASFVDYDKYYQLGLRYHIVPDRLLLVCSDLNKESASIIHDDLYHYYVCAAEDFEASLRSMLEREDV